MNFGPGLREVDAGHRAHQAEAVVDRRHHEAADHGVDRSCRGRRRG